MKNPKSLHFLLLLFLFFYTLTLKAQTIIINEIMSANESVLADHDGDFSDWIELYNTSNGIVNVAGYSLSDDINDLDKWTFPHYLIAPDNFRVVFASGKNIKTGTRRAK